MDININKEDIKIYRFSDLFRWGLDRKPLNWLQIKKRFIKTKEWYINKDDFNQLPYYILEEMWFTLLNNK
jgi:hypothetical protein